ncbi:hypothetical protein ACLOJK_027307 [Asimina triloba]
MSNLDRKRRRVKSLWREKRRSKQPSKTPLGNGRWQRNDVRKEDRPFRIRWDFSSDVKESHRFRFAALLQSLEESRQMAGMKNGRSKEENGRRAGNRQSKEDRKRKMGGEQAVGRARKIGRQRGRSEDGEAGKVGSEANRKPACDEDDGPPVMKTLVLPSALLQRRRWRRLPVTKTKTKMKTMAPPVCSDEDDGVAFSPAPTKTMAPQPCSLRIEDFWGR